MLSWPRKRWQRRQRSATHGPKFQSEGQEVFFLGPGVPCAQAQLQRQEDIQELSSY